MELRYVGLFYITASEKYENQNLEDAYASPLRVQRDSRAGVDVGAPSRTRARRRRLRRAPALVDGTAASAHVTRIRHDLIAQS